MWSLSSFTVLVNLKEKGKCVLLINRMGLVFKKVVQSVLYLEFKEAQLHKNLRFISRKE